eukprot:2533325-Rhodomonas_salina.1
MSMPGYDSACVHAARMARHALVVGSNAKLSPQARHRTSSGCHAPLSSSHATPAPYHDAPETGNVVSSVQCAPDRAGVKPEWAAFAGRTRTQRVRVLLCESGRSAAQGRTCFWRP